MPDDTNRSSPLVRKFFEEYYSDKNREKLTAFLHTQEITPDKYDEGDVSLLLHELLTGSCILEMSHQERLDLEKSLKDDSILSKQLWSKKLDLLLEDDTFLRWLVYEEKIDMKRFRKNLLSKKEKLDIDISHLNEEYGNKRAGHIKGLREYMHQIIFHLRNMEFGQSRQVDFIYNLLLLFNFEWNYEEMISDMGEFRAKDNIRVQIQQHIAKELDTSFSLLFD
jgi:hypothetical protein